MSFDVWVCDNCGLAFEFDDNREPDMDKVLEDSGL